MARLLIWTQAVKENSFVARLSDERGAGLAEYALLLFVIAVAAASVVTAFGGSIINAFTEATDQLPSSP